MLSQSGGFSQEFRRCLLLLHSVMLAFWPKKVEIKVCLNYFFSFLFGLLAKLGDILCEHLVYLKLHPLREFLD